MRKLHRLQFVGVDEVYDIDQHSEYSNDHMQAGDKKKRNT